MKKLLILFLLIASPAFAWTPDVCILGPGDGTSGGPASDNLSTNGQDNSTTWKGFRWPAGGSGDLYMFAIRVESIIGLGNSHDHTFAIYEDNAGAVGSLKVWGCEKGYNWNLLGVTRHYFDLTNVVTDRHVIAGNFYWIFLRTSTSNIGQFYMERQGSDPIPSGGGIKKGRVLSEDYCNTPPATYNVDYADNYYGWSAWTASDTEEGVANVQGCTISGGGSLH